MDPTHSDLPSSSPATTAAGAGATQPLTPARPRKRAYLPIFITFAVAFLILAIGAVVVFASLLRQTPLTVVLDGEAMHHATRATTVAELIEDLELDLDQNALIDPPPNTPITENMVVQISRARSISLTVDGQTRSLWSPLTNPADILASEGVTISDQDRILLDGTTARAEDLERWPVPVTRLNVRHAVPLIINDDGEQRTLETTSETVGDALFDAGIPLYLADSISLDVNTPVTANLEVTIERARPVTIRVDGGQIETRIQGGTVVDALADAGVALLGLDYTIPPEDTPIRDVTEIQVVRVKEEVVTETATIPFETVYQADSTLDLDQRAVTSAGQEGLIQTITRIRYENGVEVSRSTGDPTTIRAAENRVISYGTNVVLRTVDTPDGPREYWRTFRVYATSYSPEALGGDSITATGRTLEYGIVAADTRLMPFGSEVFIPGYGVGQVQDTAPPRLDGLWIDLGYSDADYRHWSRYVDIYLLTPVPANINYFLP